MAEALGINTRHVDLAVFAIGSGVAGLAGSALALIAPVTPTVGQSYIVYAFLVVILGGLGSVLGHGLAAMMIGLFSAGAQMFTSVSTSDVLLLVFVIAFIQFRPRGIVSQQARARWRRAEMRRSETSGICRRFRRASSRAALSWSVRTFAARAFPRDGHPRNGHRAGVGQCRNSAARARACSSDSAATRSRCISSLPRSVPGDIPDFMQWNGLDSLPWLWVPFKSGVFAIAAAWWFPAALAGGARVAGISSPGRRRLFRDYHAGAGAGSDDLHH